MRPATLIGGPYDGATAPPLVSEDAEETVEILNADYETKPGRFARYVRDDRDRFVFQAIYEGDVGDHWEDEEE